MLKKIAITAAAVLALGTAAQAAPPTTDLVEVNIYGASAQYTFWNATSATFLGTSEAAGGLGCSTNVDSAAGSDTYGTKKHGISWGENCSAVGGKNVIIRYSAKASYDGISSVKGEDPLNLDSCGTDYQRAMAGTVSGSDVTGLTCVDVTVGASDVAGEAFVQSSRGDLDGHFLSGTVVEPSFNGIDTTGLTKRNPVVVPFAFYLNDGVTQNTCDDGTLVGQPCGSAADCGTGATSCTPKPVENISREMAVNIFSGKIDYWDDFGPSFPHKAVVACLRHAGSGTHATLDHAVMNKKWGASLLTLQQNLPFLPLKAWFYESSSDLAAAVNALDGAIGYADADKTVGKTGPGEAYEHTYQPKYNGYKATRFNIKNGLYDFWAAQHLYWDASSESADAITVAEALNTFASNSAMLDTVPVKADYWAAQDEMNFTKASDFKYPVKK